tara:strand:- start:943 stop:1353 length:411 start_codon:yes stop_codon:yes gene_type:complete
MTKKILWVEDSKLGADILCMSISRLGITYDFFSTVRKAVQAIDSGDYNGGLYLGSLRIPQGWKGPEVEIERSEASDCDGGLCLVKYASKRGIPVLALTGTASQKVREKAIEFGAKKVLRKPANLEVVLEAFKEVFV